MGFNITNDYSAYVRRSAPEPIPADIRAQIDRAVAEGRVTRVPTGQSGVGHYVWDGYKLVRHDGPSYRDVGRRLSVSARAIARIEAGGVK